MTNLIQDFRYYLLPARNPPLHLTGLHDQVFGFWMEVWSKEMAALGVDASHLHDDFIRQDLISCICTPKEVLGILLFSFFSLEIKAATHFRYFTDNFPAEFFEKLRMMGVRSVMPCQYMAVHPDWCGRKKPTIPISLLLAGLSNRVRDQYGIDAGIAPMRSDRKIANLFDPYGSTRVIENYVSHNVACDLVANVRGLTHPHPSTEIQQIENALWRTRVDGSREITPYVTDLVAA